MIEERIAIIDGCLYNEETGEACISAKFGQKIVRCKNCDHYDTHDHRCKVWNHGVIVMGFCYKGEREDDI